MKNEKVMVEQVAILNVMGRGFLTNAGEAKFTELFQTEIVTPHNDIHVKIGGYSVNPSKRVAN